MPLDFPSNPVQGQLYSNFYYDANTGVWRALNSLYAPNFLKDATFSSSTTARVPLTVQGLASQSANLQEWKDSTGTVLAKISSTGAITSTTSSYLKDIHINRDDFGFEGGQLNFRRASDNADYWYIDVYGNTSTPSLRFVNSTSGVTTSIDGNGKLQIPNQPMFFVANQSGPTTTATNKITFNTVVTNIGSHWSAANHRFTAPVTGVYYFAHSILNGTAAAMYAAYYKNGSAMTTSLTPYGYANATIYTANTASGFLSLAANDYIELWCTAGVTHTTHVHFTGFLLG